MDNIALRDILESLQDAVVKELRLIEIGEEFEQRNKESLEHGRDELRRSGIVAPDWTPNETNANHDYWDAWSERIRNVAVELDAVGETAAADKLLRFCHQIDDRDEVTCESRFEFGVLADWLARQLQADTPPPEPETPTQADVRFRWTPPMLEGYVRDLLEEKAYPSEREATEWIGTRSGRPEPSRSTLRKTVYWQNRPRKIKKLDTIKLPSRNGEV